MQKKFTWNEDVKHIFKVSGLIDIYMGKVAIRNQDMKNTIKRAKIKLMCNHQDEWYQKLQTKPKLRFYRIFKDMYKTEAYVNCKYLNKIQRCFFSKLRGGILPLEVETGRWKKPKKIPYEQRFCKTCDMKEVGDEKHFLLFCKTNKELRDVLYNKLKQTELYNDFSTGDDDTKISILVNNDSICKYVADYVIKSLELKTACVS